MNQKEGKRKMDGAIFYRRMFVLPLLIFISLVPIGSNTSIFSSMRAWYDAAVFVFPYLLTLIISARILIKGEEQDLQTTSLRLPLWMGGIVIIGCVIIGMLCGSFAGSLYGLIYGGLLATGYIVAGYIYFLTVAFLHNFLHRLNWIRTG